MTYTNMLILVTSYQQTHRDMIITGMVILPITYILIHTLSLTTHPKLGNVEGDRIVINPLWSVHVPPGCRRMSSVASRTSKLSLTVDSNVRTRQFFSFFWVLRMENSDLSPEQTLFNEFCLNPTDPTVEIIQGSHRFISLSMQNGSSIPKKSTLSELFREFMTVPAKQYVFNQIPRKMLLELALCVLHCVKGYFTGQNFTAGSCEIHGYGRRQNYCYRTGCKPVG